MGGTAVGCQASPKLRGQSTSNRVARYVQCIQVQQCDREN